MKKLIYTSFLLVVTAVAYSQSSETTSKEYDKFGLSGMMGYNFNGKGDWANLTPELFLGWDEPLIDKKIKWNLRVGPTVSTLGRTQDTLGYLRTIMSPGNASFNILSYQTYELNSKIKLFCTQAVGIKALTGFNDTTTTILQHNFRLGLGIKVKELFSVSGQYTYGLHNLTSESEDNFKKIFLKKSTDVQYLTITIQSFVPQMGMYVYLSWKDFLNAKEFPNFDNTRMITIGLRKDLDMLFSVQTLH